MILNCFRFFLVLVMGWPLISIAEGSKSFDGKSNLAARQDISENDKNSPQLQSSGFESGKNFGEGKVEESKNKEFDLSQNESAYAFIKDIKKSEPIGFIDHMPENVPQAGPNTARQFDGFNSSKSHFVSNAASRVGSYEGVNKIYDDGGSFSDRFREEIRTELGENVYEKAVWTYDEIKGVDNWINVTMAHYGFGADSLLGNRKYSIEGLDGLLNVMVIFQQEDSVGLFSEGDGNKLRNIGAGGDKAFLNEGYQDRSVGVQAKESRFSGILKYLTIINLIYSFSAMIFVGIVARLFKLVVRQQ